jgi:hypothetical protein
MRANSAGSLSFVALGLLVLGAPREARGDTVDACVSAASSGQKLQRAGQLRAARATFLTCDKSECPAEVRAVCDRLVNSVEASMPTVIFGARDAEGSDLIAVRVRIDGTAVAESLDGKAVPMDPGPHALRFEREGGAPIEQNVVIREAEKNRSLVVTFPSSKRLPAVAGPEPVEGDREKRPIPALVYVFAGLGVASLGTFVALDVAGQSRYEACQPPHACTQSTVNSLGVERGVAIGTLGLGIVSLGVATWLFLARPTEPRSGAALSLDFEGLRGGGVLRAVGTF